MSEQHSRLDDSNLEQLLRAADPASRLSALPSWQLERLKENAMTPTPSPDRILRPRRGVLVSAGIGGVAAAAIAGGVLITAPADDTGSGVTALSAPSADAPAAMCAEPTADALASSTLAFQGTVTSIANGTVTLSVTHTYAGEIDKTATVPQGDKDQQVDGDSPVFTTGESYLVSTTGKVIRSCGLSGPADTSLTKLYTAAFSASP